MKKLSYASVVELIRFLRPVVWGFHIHLPTVGEYENLKLLAKILLVQQQMHMIVSSLGSLFMKHRFFLFHTPIIALGKVFSPPTQAKI